MALHKTDLARDTLARTTGVTLSLRERRVLILADGRRTLADLRLLLVGEDVAPLVASLVARGFLREDTVAPAAPAPATNDVARIAPKAATPPPAPTPAAPALAPARSRRSMAAAKMYLLDQLQLQRDPGVVTCRDALHAARDDEALLAAMAAGMQAMATRTSASVAERMRERVREALPEGLVARFDLLCAPPGEQPAGDHAHEAVRVA